MNHVIDESTPPAQDPNACGEKLRITISSTSCSARYSAHLIPISPVSVPTTASITNVLIPAINPEAPTHLVFLLHPIPPHRLSATISARSAPIELHILTVMVNRASSNSDSNKLIREGAVENRESEFAMSWLVDLWRCGEVMRV